VPDSPAQVRQFPCRQCGAKITFDPAAAADKCPYCGVENPIPEATEEVEELDYASFLEAAQAEGSTFEQLTVKCSSCGAQATFDPNTTSGLCPFCGAPIVAEGISRKAVKPNAVLPFKIPREQALGIFRRWIQGLWFAPGELKRFAYSEDKLVGLYLPHWTYDAHATTRYEGERGDDYTETETYTDTETYTETDSEGHPETKTRTVTKTREVTHTRWSSASGTVEDDFDDLVVLASNSLPPEHLAALQPWDLENLEPYRDEYLAGFRAESYQVGLAEGFAQAKAMMEPTIRETICDDIGGDHQRIDSLKSRYDRITFKHLLVPVWMSAYRYRGKVYRFLVNGRTGRVKGERPWSFGRIALLILAIVLVPLAILALIGLLAGGPS
jgi:predicted RNA-binding Zn-ribbon protein involved in translation (DUF1610 family)